MIDVNKPANLAFVLALVVALVGAFFEFALLPYTRMVIAVLALLGLAFGFLSMKKADGLLMLALVSVLVLAMFLPPSFRVEGQGSPIGAGGAGVWGSPVGGDILPVVPVRLILAYLADFAAPALLLVALWRISEASKA